MKKHTKNKSIRITDNIYEIAKKELKNDEGVILTAINQNEGVILIVSDNRLELTRTRGQRREKSRQ